MRRPFKLARSFKRNNERRIELIRKPDLSPVEEEELEAVSGWVDRWVDARYPVPHLCEELYQRTMELLRMREAG